MSNDVVATALFNAPINLHTNSSTRWTVTFTNGETRVGTILHLSEQVFLIQGEGQTLYCNANQVIYLTPLSEKT